MNHVERGSRRQVCSIIFFTGVIVALNVMAVEQMEAASVQRAKMNYLLHCASCHQINGKGSPGNAPDLGEYPGRFAQHPDARPFLARVPGSSSAPISDQALADVLNWILYTMNKEQLRADFKAYTAAEVGRYRRSPVVEIEKTRRALIEKVQGDYDR